MRNKIVSAIVMGGLLAATSAWAACIEYNGAQITCSGNVTPDVAGSMVYCRDPFNNTTGQQQSGEFGYPNATIVSPTGGCDRSKGRDQAADAGTEGPRTRPRKDPIVRPGPKQKPGANP